jgi:serine/threonine protein kinase
MRKLCLRCGSRFVSEADYCPHDGNLLVTDHEIPDPLLGVVLLEQFRIEAQIGTGGMGTVYRAHQTTVGRDVAIKVLRQELARDEQAVLRFEREARLAIGLDHPNLVRVFLTGRLADGRLYIVMELLEGRTLADEIEQLGPPAMDRAVILLIKLCAALGAVHSAGVVHRDIKPENVYLVRRGKDKDFVKLVDFGIARLLQAENTDPSTTQSGRIFGTASYISPEAAIGDRTDHRSDIYSLGVLAYQLLTGELPFEGSTSGALLMQHVHRQPPPMRSKGRGAEVPEALAAVVMRSLRKDPNARQQTLAELLDSLAEAAGRAGLLNDARALLLGTVWGDELAAPGSYLAELLASSTPPAGLTALADTGPVAFARDPEEEALLSSAPTPFGTTGHDLVAIPGLERRRHSRRWTLLALAVLAVVGVAAGAWWRHGFPRSDAPSTVSPPTPPMAVREEPAIPVEEGMDAPEANDVTDEPPLQPSPDAPMAAEHGKASEDAIEEIAPAPKPAVKTQKRRAAPPRKKKPHAKASASLPKSPSAPASVPEPAPAPESPSTPAPELEPDEGIDWTVPGFPDQPPTPTGMPQTPPRNPIVIDEPPTR